jgi:hypothetical protein
VDVRPFHVAAFIKDLQNTLKAPAVKRRLAALSVEEQRSKSRQRMQAIVAGMQKRERENRENLIRQAALLGVKQPQVSSLMPNRPGNFSMSRAIDFLVALGQQDVQITVGATRKEQALYRSPCLPERKEELFGRRAVLPILSTSGE